MFALKKKKKRSLCTGEQLYWPPQGLGRGAGHGQPLELSLAPPPRSQGIHLRIWLGRPLPRHLLPPRGPQVWVQAGWAWSCPVLQKAVPRSLWAPCLT